MSQLSIKNVLIIGGGRGIGLALAKELSGLAEVDSVVVTYRSIEKAQDLISLSSPKIQPLMMDPLDEVQVSDCLMQLSRDMSHLDAVIVCPGILSSTHAEPEKSLRDIDIEEMTAVFQVNAFIAPLIAKHSSALLRKSPASVFATLSAKVGSIGDNRLGGWYSYRASKAALNMFVKCIAVEFQRRKQKTVAIAIHPGTTRTELSQRYIKNSQLTIHTPQQTAKNILSVLSSLQSEDNGKFFSWDGSTLPW